MYRAMDCPTKQTWLLGEEIVNPSSFTCLRNLQNPNSNTTVEGQHPDTYLGASWRTDGEPHNNSTVLSHWFFLLSQGDIGANDFCNFYSVTGIGITNAAKVAYRTESLYLTSSSNYAAARTGSIQAARDLFGTGSSAEIAVTNAWFAVGVGAAYPSSVLSISGAELICTNATYSVANLLAGSTVTWSVSSNPSNVLILAPNTPGPNQLKITYQGFQGFITTLSAVITNGGCTRTITKTIAGDNGSNYLYGSYNQSPCTFYNVSHPAQSGTLNGNSNPPIFLHQGCVTNFNLYFTHFRDVSLAPGSLQPLSWSYNPPVVYGNPGTLYVQLPLGNTGPFTFNVSPPVGGGCTVRTLQLFSYTGNARPLAPGAVTEIPTTFAILQNPVEHELTVTALLNGKKIRVKKDFEFSMKILDENGRLKMVRKSGKGSSLQKINVSFLNSGYYILEVTWNGEKQAIKFLKE